MALAALLVIAPALAQPTVRIRAENGEVMLGARVRISTLDGRVQEFELGAPMLLKDVVLGMIKVEVLEWKGVPINFATDFFRVDSDVTIRVPGVSTATIRVLGSRGQALAGARVEIYYGDKLVETGVTDEGGVYRTTLPPAVYRVVSEYSGRRAEVSAKLPGEAALTLDVFITVGGVALSFSELIGSLLLLVLISLAIIFIAYEYTAWRRRRVVPVVAPSTGAANQ